MPASLTVTEALDPAVLAGRMKLFEVEHKKVFDVALKEVQDGYKNRHWIWSVFPQAAGLPEHFRKDSSETSRKFSILCFDEAVAFLEHPILGPNYGTRPWTTPCRVGQQVKPPRMKATLNLDRNHGGARPGGVDN